MCYVFGVEYDGSDFRGWQNFGEGGFSVQVSFEQVLLLVVDLLLQVVCVGCIDVGVYGQCQVVYFDIDVVCDLCVWMLGIIICLLCLIVVCWCVLVVEDFYVCFFVCVCCYCYCLFNCEVWFVLDWQILSWECCVLDEILMYVVGQVLFGENDFSVFCLVQCQVLYVWCELQLLQVSCQGEVIEVVVQGNVFFYYMVCNIVGLLILVGSGEKLVEWIVELLVGCDCIVVGFIVLLQGLVFFGFLYFDNWYLFVEVML